MPSHDKTPAPNRRFLPPSLASIRRTPFQSSHATSTPFSATPLATPRFQRPSARKDDIQTSFDDSQDSPILPRGRFNTQKKDLIDAGDNDLEGTSPLQHRTRTVTPATKRRKVSHPSSKKVEPITISSSPEYDDPEGDGAQDDLAAQSQSELEDRLFSVPSTPDAERLFKTPLFRSTKSAVLESSPPPRSIFKAIAGGGHLPLDGGPVLPEIFSPRRKGRRDLIPGGSADLVRSWVFDVAAQESHATTRPEQIITVSQVIKDNSGRFVVVIDQTGARWLLAEQEQRPGTGARSDWDVVRPGSRILLKGQATKWDLQTDSTTLEDVVVAAYWEPLSDG